MNFHRIILFIVLAVTLFQINPGHSQCGQDYFWASWSNFTGSSATGTLTTNSQTVNVTMTANYAFDFTNNIYNYAAFNGFSGNLPPNSRVPKTTWAVGAGGETTMCFSETVSNPVLLIASLGRIDTIVTLGFSRSYITIFDGGEMTYFNDNTLIGREGYAIIVFPGEFDCITIYSTTPEWYTNITWGLNTPLFEIDLTGEPTACDSTTISASGGSTYNWNGGSDPDSAVNTFTESGVYFITVTDDNDCTVVSSVTIDIFLDESVTIEASICEGEVYIFNNQALTQAGQYEAMIQTIHGCDSTITLNLEVNPVQNNTIQIQICEGESYLFDGQNLSTSGEYEAIFQNSKGCDSTVNLNLIVYPKNQTNIQHQMCEGEFYTFAGQQLSSPGIYEQTLQDTNSCDSTISLTLTVTSILETNIQQNICDGESYQFGDIIINEEGEYRDTLISSGGCDSIITLSPKCRKLKSMQLMLTFVRENSMNLAVIY
ncbi:MAG: hypothetical protein IPI60_08230 [Saprospiraceae bacterium]|nr:hypothetical protein [Saprospiraceae bacterium]